MEDEIIPAHLNLLEIYRRNLRHLLLQAAQYGGEQAAPLPVFNGIFEARSQIRHSKATLRAYGMVVDDHPDDEPIGHKSKREAPVNTATHSVTRRMRRVLCYELHLAGDQQQLWRSLYTIVFLPPNQCLTVSDGNLGFGALDQATFNRLVIPTIDNCSVECEIRIVDDGGDSRQWAGIRVRGLQENLMLGYLVYIRSSGSVELYRAGDVIAGANKIVASNPKTNWTHLRIDTFENTIEIKVNKRPHIRIADKSFGEKGSVYLHTHKVAAQFRNLRVYEIHR